VLGVENETGAALLDVRVTMATVFVDEYGDPLQTRLFTEDPRAIVKNANGFVFVYPGTVYGIDIDRGVVWENLDVPGVDARRCFDLQRRDSEGERDRLHALLKQRLGS
jgi:hypothetical protein